MGTEEAPRGRGALEEMGIFQGHVLYFRSRFYFRSQVAGNFRDFRRYSRLNDFWIFKAFFHILNVIPVFRRIKMDF